MLDKIDINIGSSYLSSWKESDAIKELIANAKDETENGDIKIKNNGDGSISIINIGSEIMPEHFMMKETNKNLNNCSMGHFGVGLKDAISVLFNNKIDIEIETSCYKYCPKYINKSNLVKDKCIFIVVDSNKREWVGTEVKLKNCKMDFVYEAKENFLSYNLESGREKIILSNEKGQVIKNLDSKGKKNIYINGIKVGESGTYTYSYNIFGKESYRKNKVSRDRSKLKAEVYIEDLKDIILSLKDNEVINEYWYKIISSSSGSLSGELVNIDILAYIINKKDKDRIKIRIMPPGKEEYLKIYKKLNKNARNIEGYKYLILIENHIKKLEKKIENKKILQLYEEIKKYENQTLNRKEIDEILTVEKFIKYVKKYLYEYIDKYEIVESQEYKVEDKILFIPRNRFNEKNLLNIKKEIITIVNIITDNIDYKEKVNTLKNIIDKLIGEFR
jgi:hypothetical protein